MKRAFIGDRMGRFRVPKGVFAIVKEVARHIIRRPVVGIAAAARASDGRWLLVRRADMDDWALPGGTLEWGETLRESISRELAEEAGVDRCDVTGLLGVFSRPDRDPRLHAVTILVGCAVDPPVRPPANPLEITDARLFADDELPESLAMGMHDMLRVAREGRSGVLE